MDLQTIHEQLAHGPSLIEQAAVLVAQKKEALDRARRAAEKARAEATITHQGAKNQTLLQALVESSWQVDKADAEVITANSEYLIAVSKHERAKDEFDAAKKNSNLMEAEMRSFASGRSPSAQ